MSASIVQVSVSNGGVPKLPVSSARVTVSGVEGDRQRDTRNHGGPDRAVCLFAAEVIEALQAEGHPIQAGAAGENVTVRGLDWAAMAPGVRLRLGDDVLLELTSYVIPCKNIATFFRGGDFSRLNQQLHPSWARVYARVLEEGVIRPGDAVLMLAPVAR